MRATNNLGDALDGAPLYHRYAVAWKLLKAGSYMLGRSVHTPLPTVELSRVWAGSFYISAGLTHAVFNTLGERTGTTL